MKTNWGASDDFQHQSYNPFRGEKVKKAPITQERLATLCQQNPPQCNHSIRVSNTEHDKKEDIEENFHILAASFQWLL